MLLRLYQIWVAHTIQLVMAPTIRVADRALQSSLQGLLICPIGEMGLYRTPIQTIFQALALTG